MADLVIADTSCLIVLANIGRLELLKSLYTSITITPEIRDEFGQPLPGWIQVSNAHNQDKGLALTLDKGEASVISLAITANNPLLLIDEKKGRKIARQAGCPFMGTLGVLIKAKEKGFITALNNEIKALQAVNFRMSEDLIEAVLKNYD